MDSLPPELLAMIYDKLPLKDAARLSLVCVCTFQYSPAAMLSHVSKFIYVMKDIQTITYICGYGAYQNYMISALRTRRKK